MRKKPSSWMVTVATAAVLLALRISAVKSEGNIACSRLLQLHPSDNQQQDLLLLSDFKRFICLIASRLKIGQEVALYKWQNKKAIFDPIREKFILASMVAKAKSFGMNSIWSEAFFTDQMVANRKIQEYLFGLWKCENVNLSAAPQVDLYGSIRPRLDAINAQLIQLARKTTTLRTSEWCLLLISSQVLSISDELGFDINETAIYRNVALRNVCLA